MPELRCQGLWATFNLGICSHWHNLKFFVLTGGIQTSGFLHKTPGVAFLLSFSLWDLTQGLRRWFSGWHPGSRCMRTWIFTPDPYKVGQGSSQLSFHLSSLLQQDEKQKQRTPETHRARQPGVSTQHTRDRPSTVGEGEDQDPKLSSDLHMYNTPTPTRNWEHQAYILTW